MTRLLLTAAAVRSVGPDRTDRRPSRAAGDVHAVAAGNDASHRFTGFRIHTKRFLFHALLHLKAADWFRRIGRFVNVSWHCDFTRPRVIALSAGLASRLVLY